MIVRDSVFLALRAITAHRLRSFLTLLGIAVGIAAVILLTSIGEGIHRFVLAEFSQFGTNVIGIAPGKVKVGGGPPSGLPTSVRPLTIEDAVALARVPSVIGVVPTAWGNAEVAAGGRTRRTTIYGVGADATRVFNMSVRIGQFLPPRGTGAGARRRRARADPEARDCSAPRTRSARGCASAGCSSASSACSSRRASFSASISTTPPSSRRRARLELFNRDGLTEIHLSYEEGASARAGGRRRRRGILAARHGREDFTITTQEEMLRTLSNILDILTMAVGALGSISLLVGSVGIVTIMTIAVAERTNEVGLMVALGSQRRTILGLFLGEAVVLAVLGGLIGLAVGLGLAQLIRVVVPALPVQRRSSTPFWPWLQRR